MGQIPSQRCSEEKILHLIQAQTLTHHPTSRCQSLHRLCYPVSNILYTKPIKIHTVDLPFHILQHKIPDVYWFLASLIHLRWRWHFLLKYWIIFNGLLSNILQKRELLSLLWEPQFLSKQHGLNTLNSHAGDHLTTTSFSSHCHLKLLMTAGPHYRLSLDRTEKIEKPLLSNGCCTADCFIAPAYHWVHISHCSLLKAVTLQFLFFPGVTLVIPVIWYHLISPWLSSYGDYSATPAAQSLWMLIQRSSLIRHEPIHVYHHYPWSMVQMDLVYPSQSDWSISKVLIILQNYISKEIMIKYNRAWKPMGLYDIEVATFS